MKKVNFNIPLADLSGNSIENTKIKTLVADALVSQKAEGSNILHTFELAMKINASDKEIEIKDSEKELISNLCKSGTFYVLAAAQVLKLID